MTQTDCDFEIDGSQGRIDIVGNDASHTSAIFVYIRSHFTSRGDVVVRDGFAISDHSILILKGCTFEIYQGFHSHHNWATGGSAGLLFIDTTSGIAEGIVVEDNFVSGEPNMCGHGHGGGGIMFADDSSLLLRNSVLRRNSVSTPTRTC